MAESMLRRCSSVKLIRSEIASYEVDTSAPSTSFATPVSTTYTTTSKSNSSKLNKYVDPTKQVSHSSISQSSSSSSSSSSLSSGKMFSMFSFVGPQQPFNGRIADSQQTSNRHKSSSDSGYGSAYNRASSSSSSSSSYHSHDQQASSSIDHHHHHPLSAKSPVVGNIPVKAPTSGELSDQIKKYVIVVMIVKMML